jgi:hypothetical protein
LVLIALAVAAAVVPARPAAADETLPEVQRVLVLALPGVTWADIADNDVPNLRALLDASAVADLAPRVEKLKTDVGDGYATVGAGTRALGRASAAGLAFEPDERFEGSNADDVYRLQQVKRPTGDVVHLRWSVIKRSNVHSLYDAKVGALGDALTAGGISRGVVANADDVWTTPSSDTYHREAALAMVGSDGQVPCGAVGPDLLRNDAQAPFGVVLDANKVDTEFSRCWSPRRSVVLVEGSDLARVQEYAGVLTSQRFDVLWREALRRTDALVGRLLRKVDPTRDGVVVVSPSAAQTKSPRTVVFGVRAPGLGPGLLESGVTRQTGFVSIVDVAPTIARLVRAPLADEDIEGRAVSVARDGGDAHDRLNFLVHADEDARFRDRTLLPFMSTFIGLIVLLAAAAALSVLLGKHWRVLEPLSLALLAVLPLTYWAAILPFRDWGSGAYYLFTLGGGLLIGGALHLMRGRFALPLVVVLSLIIATTAISVMLLDSRLQLSTVFGDSPIVAGRFSGVNNVTFSQLMVAAILLAAFLRPVRATTGRWFVLALFVFVLALDGAPMWGADVGGVLAGLPAFALVFTLLAPWKVRIRTVVTWVLVTIGVIVALGLLDLTRDSSHRTHLGRLFERIGKDGWSGFSTVVGRKINMNLATLTSSVWRWLFIPVLLLAAYVLWRAPGRFSTLREHVPTLEQAWIGIGAAALLGYALNDSGIAVPGVMLAVLTPATVYLLNRVDERSAAVPLARGEPASAEPVPDAPAAAPVA